MKRTPLNVLIFNWYDVKHAYAGGAEIYIHRIAQYLIRQGHNVTMFCGNDGHSPKQEVLDGITIFRRGSMYSVALWAFIYYFFKFRGKFDVVVDAAKGVPFFTPLYVRKPIVTLIHHIHREMFKTGLKPPLRGLAIYLESVAMPLVYGRVDMIAVSDSTRKALRQMGLGRAKPIQIVHPGAEIKRCDIPKTEYPSVVYLGRLRYYKRIDLLLHAVAQLKRNHPDIKLIIAGTGEAADDLKDLAGRLDLGDTIEFSGRVTERRKAELLTSAWVAAYPSIVEGWGITNIEANLCGTPVVASDVDGLRDSVVDRKTGILVPVTNTEALRDTLERIISHKELRETLSRNAIEWGRKFSWEESSSKFLGIIESVARRA